jgi:hypothetical protein
METLHMKSFRNIEGKTRRDRERNEIFRKEIGI